MDFWEKIVKPLQPSHIFSAPFGFWPTSHKAVPSWAEYAKAGVAALRSGGGTQAYLMAETATPMDAALVFAYQGWSTLPNLEFRTGAAAALQKSAMVFQTANAAVKNGFALDNIHDLPYVNREIMLSYLNIICNTPES